MPTVQEMVATKSQYDGSLEETNEDFLKGSIRKSRGRGGLVEPIVELIKHINCRSRGNDGARERFTKELCQTYNNKHNRKMNIMVFNVEQSFDDRFHNVREEVNTEICGIPYRVWAFESGEFTNKGDGGFINWCFIGKLDRDGGHVKFHKR